MKLNANCDFALRDAPFARTTKRQGALLRILLAPLQVVVAVPAALYLFTFTVFLFRPPALEFHSIDRIAFLSLVVVVALRLVLAPCRLPRNDLSLAMVGLALLAGSGLLRHPFEASTWSVLAAKFFVPFAMFWMAGLVFRDERTLRWLERFWLVVLAYLSFVSIAHLLGAYDLVFPHFILDESLGIHADRARGPFLQAVANGVTLNMLGIFAIEGYRRRRLKGATGVLLLAALPLAIVATKTRGVWLSFAASVIWLTWRLNDRRLRRAILALGATGVLLIVGVVRFGDFGRGLDDRIEENSSVEFRLAAYRAGYEMFLERPLFGWGTKELQDELAFRINGFRGESFAVHNTYLDVLLEQGIVGLALYLWIVLAMFRLGRKGMEDSATVLGSMRSVWAPVLAVYFLNATFVVMNYQFVNGFLFTCAGILAAQSKSPNELDLGTRSQ